MEPEDAINILHLCIIYMRDSQRTLPAVNYASKICKLKKTS